MTQDRTDEETARLVARSIMGVLQELKTPPSPSLAAVFLGMAAGVGLHTEMSREQWLALATAEWELAKKLSVGL